MIFLSTNFPKFNALSFCFVAITKSLWVLSSQIKAYKAVSSPDCIYTICHLLIVWLFENCEHQTPSADWRPSRRIASMTKQGIYALIFSHSLTIRTNRENAIIITEKTCPTGRSYIDFALSPLRWYKLQAAETQMWIHAPKVDFPVNCVTSSWTW